MNTSPERGGFVLGLIVGLLIGLTLALGVALYITKVPIPFVNKVPQRTAEQDAAEAERNKNWDPNAPLAGKAARSASGVVIGPDQRVTAYQGLRAVTANAAWQIKEEKNKGTLEVGKLADLVILERNPLTVDPATIKDIAVLETIKEGRTIYRRDDQRRAAVPGGLEDERPCPHDLAAGPEAPLTSQARETLTLLLGAAR